MSSSEKNAPAACSQESPFIAVRVYPAMNFLHDSASSLEPLRITVLDRRREGTIYVAVREGLCLCTCVSIYWALRTMYGSHKGEAHQKSSRNDCSIPKLLRRDHQ